MNFKNVNASYNQIHLTVNEQQKAIITGFGDFLTKKHKVQLDYDVNKAQRHLSNILMGDISQELSSVVVMFSTTNFIIWFMS